MDAIKAWWEEAPARDQMAVLILGLALAVFIVFDFIVSPVSEMRAKQERRVVAQQAALERVKDLAAQLKARASGPGAGAANASIEKKVERSFGQHSLRVTGFDASGRSGIRVRFDSVKYEKLLAWLHDMEISQGMRMKDISIASSTAPGLVSASVLIAKQ